MALVLLSRVYVYSVNFPVFLLLNAQSQQTFNTNPTSMMVKCDRTIFWYTFYNGKICPPIAYL
ncbi:hypothetical protein [Coleofasciculus sp. E1-EBD-02]|uniref:hypothetical protein n=1 Tax=Coleofasciculus sp. E1-EBD-02 TaxID=3068481 RepID=UPI0032F41C07